MKIAFIGYEANIKNRVGSNQYAFELLKAFHRLDQENEYVVYLPSKALPDLPQERGKWHYRVVGPRKFWSLLALPLALLKEKPKFDLIFNPGHYSPLIFPAPLYVSIMDLGYLRFPEHFSKKIYWKLRLGTAFSLKRASFVFPISEATQNDIIKYYRLRKDRIKVSYPGIDHQSFNLKAKDEKKIARVKRKYKIKGGYLFYLGTLKPSKNIKGLIKAFKVIKDKGLNLKLVITGKKGWLYEDIFAEVKKLGLVEEVVFTGFADEADLPNLMAGAEVFVLPSFFEGFGIPAIEAMACGAPVVVSKAGSLPEIVDKAGVVVNPADHQDIARGIKEALSKKEELAKLGLERSKKFTWEGCAKKILKVLKEEKDKNVFF